MLSRRAYSSVLSVALALSACNDASDAPSPADASPDAHDPLADAGPPPDDDDGGVDAAAPLPELPPPWRREPSLPLGVDHHTSAIIDTPAGTYLFVLGGMRATSTGQPDAVYDAVHRARIGDDGALGPWEAEAPLNAPFAFQAIAVRGRTIFLAGGLSTRAGGVGWIPYVMWAPIDDDGHLAPWRGLELLESATLHGAATVVGERLYLVGGGAGTASSHTIVLSLRVGDDAVDDLRSETSLPAPRSHHVLFARDGFLYVAGGFEGPPAPAVRVLRSPIGADGALGEWQDAGAIDEPAWTAALVEIEDGFVLVGGGVGDGPTDRVSRFAIDAEGRVGPPELLAPLPYPRAHVHQTPVHAGRLYSVGGRAARGLGQSSSADVYSAPLSSLEH